MVQLVTNDGFLHWVVLDDRGAIGEKIWISYLVLVRLSRQGPVGPLRARMEDDERSSGPESTFRTSKLSDC
jgi:hypothetical protein